MSTIYSKSNKKGSPRSRYWRWLLGRVVNLLKVVCCAPKSARAPWRLCDALLYIDLSFLPSFFLLRVPSLIQYNTCSYSLSPVPLCSVTEGRTSGCMNLTLCMYSLIKFVHNPVCNRSLNQAQKWMLWYRLACARVCFVHDWLQMLTQDAQTLDMHPPFSIQRPWRLQATLFQVIRKADLMIHRVPWAQHIVPCNLTMATETFGCDIYSSLYLHHADDHTNRPCCTLLWA